MDVDIEFIKDLAKKAGKNILSYYKKEITVQYKNDNSPVTLADKEANSIIVDSLINEYPLASILTEESEDDLSRLNNRYCFIIDPLDGTKEFLKGNDEFTVNIALSVDGDIHMSVVYHPVKDELYYAIKNRGAYRECYGIKEKIRVSERLGNLIVLKSRSHSSSRIDELFSNNREKINKIIPCGSSLKGCLIAKGEADIYYRFSTINEWDVAAVSCIVKEAGGVIRETDNSELIFNKRTVQFEKGLYIVNRIENILKL